jgi:hypothetical protein
MLKNKTAKLAVGAALALGSVGTVVLGAGAASAATTGTVHPEYYRCSSGGIGGICATLLWTTELDNAGGGEIAMLNYGSTVNVECWYPDTTPGTDGYYDHVSWSSQIGSTSGHVDDNLVDFNNQTPRAVGLPECAS